MNKHKLFIQLSHGAAMAMLLVLGAVLFAPLQAWAASAVITLSDPVPTLLDGPKVTTNVNRLAAGARPVEGVAADGVSRIVIAVTAASAGQPVTFTIHNGKGAPSASTAENGALAAVGSGDFDHSRLATAAVTTNRGAMAFVIYRAPLDFARPGSDDDTLFERTVSIHWMIAGTPKAGNIPIIILRPPVVLIHGLWGIPAHWDDFTPLIGDPRFSIYLANYGSLAQPISSSVPSLEKTSSIPANALGFAYNARYVAPQIDSFVNSFKRRHNPARLAVAAIQADVVAHSMGGDIARTMPLMIGFASATTFGRGNIHKLITIDTPHLGSPLAIDMLPIADGSDPNACLNGVFDMRKHYVLESVKTPDGRTISGAIGDMRGNGKGGKLSPALQILLSSSAKPPLQTSLLPTAFIASIAGPIQLGGLDYCHKHYKNIPPPKRCFVYALIQKICSKAPLVKNLTSAAWKNKVMRGPSDALVPLTSEYDGHSHALSPLTAIHAPRLKILGMLGPGVLQSQAGAPEEVIDLLNTWIAKSPPFVPLR